MRENYNYHTIGEVQQFAKSVGCECLENHYENDKHPMKFIPCCGHGIIFRSFKEFRISKYYQLCDGCRKRFHSDRCHFARLKSFESVKKLIESSGCKLYTSENEYYNTGTKLDIELTCGCHKIESFHKWRMNYFDNSPRYNRSLICSKHYWEKI